MTSRVLWSFTVVLLATALAPLQAAGLTLVKDGMPNATIVVAPEPPPPPAPAGSATKPAPAEKSKWLRAAEAIQTYVEKMSGAKLPIVAEGAPLEGQPAARVLVGPTAAAKKLGKTVPGGFNPAIRPEIFEEEGYVLKTAGTALIVAGNNDGPYQGTLYAAYALLEQLGCRWYFPGAWGEVVPQEKTIVVPALDIVSRPDFAIRGIWLSCWNPAADYTAYNDWCMKVGFSGPRLGYPVAGDGYLAALLPPAEYADAHPEYYAMNEQGKRDVTAQASPSFTMLCLSNPDVLAASIENLKAAFAGRKMLTCVSEFGVGISPPDGTPFCFCDQCKAVGQNFDYPTYEDKRMMSEEYCTFAAGLARAFPDKFVSLSGYSLREMPPQGVALPPNVAVSLWPITSCVLHAGTDPACWRRQETLRILEGWRKLTPHVVACGYTPGLLSVYTPCGGYVPERDVPQFSTEAPLLKKMGVKGSFDQGAAAFMATWLSAYVRAKLLWNVHVDVAKLKQDFYMTFFGPDAGPQVQAWWDACEAALGKASCHAHEDWLLNHINTTAFTQRLHAYVEAARKAKMTDEQRARFEAFALIADNLEAYAAMHDAERKLDYAGAIRETERMMSDRAKLLAIDSFFVIGNPAKGGGKEQWANGNARELHRLAARTDGTTGTLVAGIPLEARFNRDPFNEGVLAGWYAPNFNDQAWGTTNTFLTWDQQDPPEDARGHDYDGYGWYRVTVDVPGDAAGKPLTLYLGGVINEGWVWINGQYAGHRGHALWWAGREALEMEVDATGKVKPGTNLIAIRVWNNAEIGGLYRRGFLYAPNPEPVVQ